VAEVDLHGGPRGGDGPPTGVVLRELDAHPGAVVTDVASVKDSVAAEVRAHGADSARRYVGSNPMAGRERSGLDARALPAEFTAAMDEDLNLAGAMAVIHATLKRLNTELAAP